MNYMRSTPRPAALITPRAARMVLMIGINLRPIKWLITGGRGAGNQQL